MGQSGPVCVNRIINSGTQDQIPNRAKQSSSSVSSFLSVKDVQYSRLVLIRRSVKKIKKSSHFCSTCTVLEVICALISFHLVDCSSRSQKSVSHLQPLHKAAARILTCVAQRHNVSSISSSLHQFKLFYNIKLGILVMIFKAHQSVYLQLH